MRNVLWKSHFLLNNNCINWSAAAIQCNAHHWVNRSVKLTPKIFEKNLRKKIWKIIITEHVIVSLSPVSKQNWVSVMHVCLRSNVVYAILNWLWIQLIMTQKWPNQTQQGWMQSTDEQPIFLYSKDKQRSVWECLSQCLCQHVVVYIEFSTSIQL